MLMIQEDRFFELIIYYIFVHQCTNSLLFKERNFFFLMNCCSLILAKVVNFFISHIFLAFFFNPCDWITFGALIGSCPKCLLRLQGRAAIDEIFLFDVAFQQLCGSLDLFILFWMSCSIVSRTDNYDRKCVSVALSRLYWQAEWCLKLFSVISECY